MYVTFHQIGYIDYIGWVPVTVSYLRWLNRVPLATQCSCGIWVAFEALDLVHTHSCIQWGHTQKKNSLKPSHVWWAWYSLWWAWYSLALQVLLDLHTWPYWLTTVLNCRQGLWYADLARALIATFELAQMKQLYYTENLIVKYWWKIGALNIFLEVNICRGKMSMAGISCFCAVT